jgi:4-azaleucine resistance transporter AzlC
MDKTAVTFTLRGALEGAKRCLPIEISGFAIGLVFGVLAGQAGLSVAESVLMSALVFSGAAQFVVLGLWATPLSVASIVLATLVVGLRHLLMGAALSPFFSRLGRLKAYGSVFFMADENWALTMSEFSKGRRDAAFLIGGGLAMFLSWTTSTLIGRTVGGALRDPALGIGFRVYRRVFGVARRNVEGEVRSPALGHGGARGGDGPPVATRAVVHPARWAGREPRGGGAA